jgi:hypothetical protein
VNDINDIFAQLPIGEIAKELGVSKDEASKGVALALPALVSGLHANAADPKGAASILGALDSKDTSLIDGGISLSDVDTADGTKIVKHIFGAATPDVAAKLGGATGGSSSSGGGIGDILGQVLGGAVNGGSSLEGASNDVLGGLGGLLGGLLGGGTK